MNNTDALAGNLSSAGSMEQPEICVISQEDKSEEFNFRPQLSTQVKNKESSSLDYIRLTEPSEKIQLAINNVLVNGHFLLIDGSGLGYTELKEVMAQKIGIGFTAPVVLVYRSYEVKNDIVHYLLRFHVVESAGSSVTQDQFSSSNIDILEDHHISEMIQIINAAIEESNARINLSKSQEEPNRNVMPGRLPANSVDIAKAVPEIAGSPFFPGEQFEIILRKSDISCIMEDGSGVEGETFDYCEGKASVDVKYSIALIRSVEASLEDGIFTKNAKFVRISISEDMGTGAGIHLTDRIIQEDVTWEGWSNRRTRIGPFADSYSLWVKPVDGVKPAIFSKKPDNINTNFHKSEKNVFNIGTGLELSLKPTPEIATYVNFGIIHTRVLDWHTHEYRIRNQSSVSDFFITWERALGNCDEINYREAGCYFTSALWGKYGIYNQEKFTPISYANFTPNFDVIYEMPADQSGFTDFQLGVSVSASVKFGTVKPIALFSLYQTDGQVYSNFDLTAQFRVNWDHALFEPGVPTRIRSLEYDNICITATGENNENKTSQSFSLKGLACSDSANQIWSMDSLERLQARFAKGLCLTAMADKTVQLSACNNTLSQKWYWEGDFLYSRAIINIDTHHPAVYLNNEFDLSVISAEQLQLKESDGSYPGSQYHIRWTPEIVKFRGSD